MTPVIRLITLCLALSHASAQSVRGVAPTKQDLYKNDGQFRCLDGSKTIDAARINDDYCDCPDGSDEPGTSACHNGTFFCQNAGHRPAYIPSSRVNDGTCEHSCCDGSDEWLGIVSCPNTCKQQAKEYAILEKERLAVESAGGQVKQKWILEAQQLRRDIDNEIARREVALSADRANIIDKEAALEKLQSEGGGLDDAALDNEKHMRDLRGAIERLERQLAAHAQRVRELEGIMSSMAESYNPNFQDMAVKGAVSSFNELSSLEREEVQFADVLQAIETAIDKPSAVPVAEAGWRQTLRKQLVSYGLIQGKHDIVGEKGETRQVANMRETVEKRREEILQNEREISNLRNSLTENFGEHDVYRAVKGQCFSSLISDYTYEVCLLQTLYQKSSSSSTLVGNFDRVDEDGSLIYNHGHKCWNGPERSGRVEITCGAKNELLSVREAQKCEYVFKITSPLACKANKSNRIDEL